MWWLGMRSRRNETLICLVLDFVFTLFLFVLNFVSKFGSEEILAQCLASEKSSDKGVDSEFKA